MDRVGLSLIICLVYFTIMFLIGSKMKNNAIVDMAWGPGFIILSLIMIVYEQKIPYVNGVQCLLISIWGIRLFTHVYKRNRGKPEDYRYQNFRKKWGKHPYLGAFFQVYMLQAIFMWIISFAFLFVDNDYMINVDGVFLGIYLWIIGFIFESVGDAQLKRFVQDSNNKGKIIQTGLWKYSRHPNYFGEALMWWGIAFISFSDNGYALSFVGAVWITLSLLFISGVPLLEKRNQNKEGYEEYKRKTSVFIPWFPKE